MNNYLRKILATGVLSVLLVSCDEDKTTVDSVFSDVQRGAILRTVSTPSANFNFFDPTSVFSVNMEVEDHNEGALLDKVDILVGFVDNTPDSNNFSVAESPFETLTASDFSTNSSGLPETNLTIPLSEALAHVGRVDGEYNGGDLFTVRLILTLTDGRTFTNTNSAGTVTGGSFFRSPFVYRPALTCPSELDVEFNWVATDFFFQGTPLGNLGSPSGTDSFVRTSPTSYTYASGLFDFGYYCVVYDGEAPGCGSGASGTLRLTDTCGKLAYIGTDQFGDPWVITNLSVSGSTMTFTWESAYGERSTVALTRTDGEDWPDGLFSD